MNKLISKSLLFSFCFFLGSINPSYAKSSLCYFKKVANKYALTAFKEEFISKKENEWRSFVKRLNQEHPPSLSDVIGSLKLFLLPVVKTLTTKEPAPKQWKAPGPWK